MEYNTERPHSARGYRPPQRKQSCQSMDMEIWKTLRVSHIPTSPATTTDKCPTRRYANNHFYKRSVRSEELLKREAKWKRAQAQKK